MACRILARDQQPPRGKREVYARWPIRAINDRETLLMLTPGSLDRNDHEQRFEDESRLEAHLKK